MRLIAFIALLASLAVPAAAQPPQPAPPPQPAQPPQPAPAPVPVPNPAPPQPPSAPRTPRQPGASSFTRTKADQNVPVTKGMRLSVSNFAGSMTVRTWDKDAVRVEAEHSSRDRITVRPTEAVLRVGASSEHGPSRTVDFTLTVPRWMPLELNGTYVDIDLEGMQGEVTAETVGGDVRLKGGSGTVSLKSVEGVIEVEGAKGRMSLNTVNEGIFVRDVAGELAAETVNGDVTLERIDSNSVEVGTVNGDVTYDGSIRDGGSYRFATHNGDVELRVPDQINASVFVRTYRGDFESHFQVTVPGQAAAGEEDEFDRRRRERRNRRFNFTLGSGAARLEMESFGGDISLFKRSQVAQKVKSKKHEHDEQPHDPLQ
jgi:Putative adhesin